jgi:hypothetical protein
MSKLLCAILSTIMLWWWGWTNASPGNGLKRRTLLRMTENEPTKINGDEQKILKTINGTSNLSMGSNIYKKYFRQKRLMLT